jgi:hypothetical protein
MSRATSRSVPATVSKLVERDLWRQRRQLLRLFHGFARQLQRRHLYSGNTAILQINGSDMAHAASLMADGDQSHGFYMNFATNSGTTIERGDLSSVSNAFETDNHLHRGRTGTETYAMLLTGLGLVGFASRRRREPSEERFY